ncbi:Machado-joseph disease protein MJD [Hyaloraphidium curvatum]|nr:Machado-joseph disease protein MJD [Hyaloraphidium curvatum]
MAAVTSSPSAPVPRRSFVERMAEIYHERQSLQLCCQHALNNLLQKKTFTKADLDRISVKLHSASMAMARDGGGGRPSAKRFFRQLFSFNQHRSVLGTGYYDVNVLEAALLNQGLDLEWFDMRRSVFEIDLEDDEDLEASSDSDSDSGAKLGRRLIGMIIHTPEDHWQSVRWFPVRDEETGQLVKEWWNLDSKLDFPTILGRAGRVKAWLDKRADVQILLVYSPMGHI